MRTILVLAGLAGALTVSGCTTVESVTKNPNCVTRVSLKGSYGGGIPTGTWSASAVCNAPVKTPAGAVQAPPADDPAPPPPPS